MTKVFLTGATGVMGSAGLRELREAGQYDITVLARDSKKNHKMLDPMTDVKVIWGDLRDYEAVRRGVEGADIVLHVGGMVSPAADWHPELCYKTNTEGMANIVRAVRETGGDDTVKVVYIGSVAQYGPHNPPHHWGDADVAQTPARFDEYARSKVDAEKILRASPIRRFAVLRQTGILHPGLLGKATDPITYHVPFEGVLEWASVEDSGRLLERVSRPEVPESFWGKAYNISSGPSYRLTNYEFECKILGALGLGRPEQLFDAHWFATGNFHGMWYTDSDDLEAILHFRSGETADEWFDRLRRESPFYLKLAPLAPKFLIKAFMGHVARSTPLSPLRWLREGNEERIRAAWGSRENWERLKRDGWKALNLTRPADIPAGKGTAKPR